MTCPAGRGRRSKDEPAGPTLREQAAAIAAGEADPAELLDAALARIEERNPALNAVVETFPERSREMLAAAPEGPLHGVPVVIKDEWPLPWRAQRFGAAEHARPDRARRVRPLPRAARRRRGDRRRRQHARARGRAAPATSPSTAPPATPGTPSAARAAPRAAPAAAVAARLVAGAVGADGIGSIRYPAAYCGLTGLKPTFGRSAMEGHHMARVTTTIVSGPLCADAADCRLLGSASCSARSCRAGDAAGLRIGVVRDAVSEDVAPEVREACEEAIEALRDGDRRRGRRGRRSPTCERAAGRGPDRQHRGARRRHARAAQRARARS